MVKNHNAPNENHHKNEYTERQFTRACQCAKERHEEAAQKFPHRQKTEGPRRALLFSI